jgi:copper chaperone CopZ
MTTYAVSGMSCQHCVDAITAEVSGVAGVEGVVVDLAAGTVTVSGAPDDATVRAAIDEAGYEVRP